MQLPVRYRFIKIFLGLVALFFFSHSVFGQENSSVNKVLEELRKKIPDAFLDEKTGLILYEKYKLVQTNDALTKGYIASLYFAYSKHASLFKKMEAFNKGRSMMDAAVKSAPDNIELVFLRLSVQMKVPGFLGYDSQIPSDKKTVLAGYEKTVPLIRHRIYEFVRAESGFTSSEKSMVKP